MAETTAVRITRVDYGDPDAVRLVAEVQQEYVRRYGSPDDTPLDPLMFVPPTGSFFVAYDDADAGRPVATGAWRRSDVVVLGTARTAEVKRMYVVESARGRGLARLVLAHLEATAAAAGAEALVLETGIAQPEAIALYESSGYTRVPGFGHYRDSPLSRCYGKDLRCSSR
ncbi:GNAT family N-acetyltransferase [Nocardioides dongxiaopingii]|uniref:GNAT family N-acetyltransferase n=1 Tax=Nocardioides TaxID=1839 RepID=UPI0010C76307|nr:MULTISPECIES: GNAT family N-acetyltransferase [Nocardioides]QCW51658.1 GNAT family N-acetyltransferase [Nocardioides sp. S-1144]